MAFLKELASKSAKLQENEVTHSAVATEESKEQQKEKYQSPVKKCPRCETDILEFEFESHLTNHASEILPWLYLGAQRNACNLKELKERIQITHILNCAIEVECYFPNDFVYKKLDLDDVKTENITDLVDDALQFIVKCKDSEKKGKILVHCAQGISRSSSIVIAYLIKHEKLTYEKALSHVKSIRRIAQPNSGFEEQLRKLEKTWISPTI
ncbi:hypothetical protein RFI_10019 [Reticulomyxa filosa]|uniref:Dual specificity protein phosphatase n=1 Tax=Reticulomyxa filosa TaxID=46433 RepID=X6NN26_RETFI|nr:hypothetical protein RFI_10019 [Reticulomyxa filosa]|eukprot:ETO27114.1 hypothetical protein RFI_10019 [Reticulomyxa filosa]